MTLNLWNIDNNVYLLISGVILTRVATAEQLSVYQNLTLTVSSDVEKCSEMQQKVFRYTE